MSNAIIRILFGNPDAYPRMKAEVASALRHEWARKEVYHFVVGRKNLELLKSNGAERIELVSEDDTLANSVTSSFYNKTFLIGHAMNRFSEILFLDFDCIPMDGKRPDDNMWNILRSKKGKFNGSFQSPNIGYVCSFCLSKHQGGVRDPKIHSLRKCINTSFVYCTDKTWMDEWLENYDKFRNVLPSKDTSKKYHDEHVLMYYLDTKYGVMDANEMVENFEPLVMRLSRNITEAKKIKNDAQLYFLHA